MNKNLITVYTLLAVIPANAGIHPSVSPLTKGGIEGGSGCPTKNFGHDEQTAFMHRF